MTDTTFRVPVPDTTPDVPSSVADKPIEKVGSPVETHAPELLSTYQDDMGKPYVAKYLELDTVWDAEPHLRNELATIEGFIREQVKKGNLENSTKAADKYLKDLEKRAETNPYESTTNRISKLLAYIEFRNVVDG